MILKLACDLETPYSSSENKIIKNFIQENI